MTDTRTLYTLAVDRKTGQARKFWGIHSDVHHTAAIKWLRRMK